MVEQQQKNIAIKQTKLSKFKKTKVRVFMVEQNEWGNTKIRTIKFVEVDDTENDNPDK
jgi:hypothetical protein